MRRARGRRGRVPRGRRYRESSVRARHESIGRSRRSTGTRAAIAITATAIAGRPRNVATQGQIVTYACYRALDVAGRLGLHSSHGFLFGLRRQDAAQHLGCAARIRHRHRRHGRRISRRGRRRSLLALLGPGGLVRCGAGRGTGTTLLWDVVVLHVRHPQLGMLYRDCGQLRLRPERRLCLPVGRPSRRKPSSTPEPARKEGGALGIHLALHQRPLETRPAILGQRTAGTGSARARCGIRQDVINAVASGAFTGARTALAQATVDE